MIELFDGDRMEFSRKSSKGNQLKFERDGVWYKADYTGYEGLVEYVVSHLLEKSSLKADEFVLYDQEEIRYRGRVFMGAVSRNFLHEGEQLVTLERLFASTFGTGLNSMIYGIANHEERLRMLVERTEEITGISGFGRYIASMMAIDAFFLNEDRHTHNIAAIRCEDGRYRLCPYFDHGAGLLADTTIDYPLEGDTYKLMGEVRAKTFCEDFDEQLEIAERLYGKQIRFHFSRKDVDAVLDGVHGYDHRAVARVRDVVAEQMRKYRYMFV